MAKHVIQPRLVEIQCYLDKYFNQNIAPKLQAAMKKVNAHRMAQYEKDTSMSFAHSFASLKTARIGIDDVQLNATTKALNGYNKELMQEFKKVLQGDKHIQKDLAKISLELRVHLLQQMAHHYGDEGKAIKILQNMNAANGTDITYAYVSEVIASKAVEKIASKQMPKSTLTYILNHGFGDSIYSSLLFPSDALDSYVKDTADKKYKAGRFTKFCSTAVSSIIDSASMGTATPNGFLIGVNIDCLERFRSDYADHIVKKKGNIGYVDSSSLLGDIYNGSKTSFVFAEEKGKKYDPNKSEYIKSLNQQMTRKVRSINVPISHSKVVAPSTHSGQDSPHLSSSHKHAHSVTSVDVQSPSTLNYTTAAVSPQQNNTTSANNNWQNESSSSTQDLNNSQGWQGIFEKAVHGLGLNGFSDVHKNIGYVLAMLPDMMLGMLTGKNPNLKLEDNLLPLAAIMGGLFVKNPLLKIMMLGLGGAKILNSTGHEALREAGIESDIRYKKYADESLDKRLSDLKLQGNTLVFTVDGVPTVATVSNMVVDAYKKGALPLNVIANNVLKKYDEQQQISSRAYSIQEKIDNVEERTRSLK